MRLGKLINKLQILLRLLKVKFIEGLKNITAIEYEGVMASSIDPDFQPELLELSNECKFYLFINCNYKSSMEVVLVFHWGLCALATDFTLL